MTDSLKTLISALSRGIPVLTVNRRLARYLLTRFEQAEVASGRVLWKTPGVMPFSSWLKSLWADSRPPRALLTGARSSAIWKQIISADKAISSKVLFPEGVVSLASRAYELTKKYCLDLSMESIYLTDEARAFRRWLAEYERILASQGFTDEASLFDEVEALLASGRTQAPQEVIIAGFDEVTPAMEGVLCALETAGCRVGFWPHAPGSLIPGEGPVAREIYGYDDMRTEARAAAQWARARVEAGERIGIIVPELERYREVVINEFRAELSPSAVIPWETEQEVFNISLGAPLSLEPIVRSALDLLSIGPRKQETESFIRALSTPYFLANEAEALDLAALGEALKAAKVTETGLQGLAREAGRGGGPLAGLFADRLRRWAGALHERLAERALPSEWARFFDDLLKDLNWPSPCITLSSREYQALEAWQGLLATLGTLDDLMGRITRQEALAEVRTLAAETIHQPQSEGERPVEVLGILEAAGMEFDSVWILGAHEDALPEEVSPNPFLPYEEQKRAGLPRSTPERTLQFARLVLERIKRSAPLVVASYPRMVDGKELRPSPLLGVEGAGLIKDPPCTTGHSLGQSVQSTGAGIEVFVDNMRVPLEARELQTIRGGTGIIKEQSACPFRAFAIYRLGARGQRGAGPGIDALERGSLVHEALENFWTSVRDSRHLHEAAEDGRLPSLIKEAVTRAVERFGKEEGRRVPARMLELETERLEALLGEWMEVELGRGDFSVAEMEKSRDINVGGLTIGARIDRVDEVEGGRKIIIDYKTSACKKDDWLPDRPREPQLLLYAMDGGFNALAFASLRLKGTRFVGLGEEEGILPGLTAIESDERWRQKMEGVENWADLRERWRESLIALAEEFIRGEARVEPNPLLRANEFPCRYCDLTMLCRRFELGLYGDEDDGED